MENKYVLVVVLFLVLGSAMVSSLDSLSHTFKMTFYSIALIILVGIGSMNIYNFFKN